HALDALEDLGKHYDLLVLLEPTSPLREVKDIDSALESLLACSEAESIVGVGRVEAAHPAFLLRRNGLFLQPFSQQDFSAKRRQDIDELFFLEGTIYATWVEAFRRRRSFYHDRTIGYEVSKYKSFEVDDLVDFTIIEALMEARM